MRFKVGDRVRCSDANCSDYGKVGKVMGVRMSLFDGSEELVRTDYSVIFRYAWRFEPIKMTPVERAAWDYCNRELRA